MAKLLVNIDPLKQYPAFRRLWTGYAISAIGTQMTIVALAYEVYKITGSSFDVGLISLIQLVPLLTGSITGGSIADAMDRRRLLLITGFLMAGSSIGMAIDASSAHPTLGPLYGLAACSALATGVNAPTLIAVFNSIVEKDAIVPANALRQLLTNIAVIIGPAIGGVVIAASGAKVAFWVDAASFSFAIFSVLTVKGGIKASGGTKFGFNSIAEGFRFLKGKKAIQGCFIADLNATILGQPTALFPAIALHHFHGGSKTLGLIYAAPGIGAFLGSVFSGWTHRTPRPGRAVCIAIVLWGLSLTAFGLSRSLLLGVVMLGVAGASDVISAVLRTSITQIEAPDKLRGRIASIQQAVVAGGPRLGNTEAGFVASAWSTQGAVISGGIGCVVGIAIIAKLLPEFVNYKMPAADLTVAGGQK